MPKTPQGGYGGEEVQPAFLVFLGKVGRTHAVDLLLGQGVVWRLLLLTLGVYEGFEGLLPNFLSVVNGKVSWRVWIHGVYGRCLH